MPIPTLSAHGQYVQLTLTNQTLKKYDNIPRRAARQGGGMDARQQVWEYFSEKGATGWSGRNKQTVYPQDGWWHHYLPITASPTIWMESLPTAQNNCSLWGTVRLAFRKHICKTTAQSILDRFLKQTTSRFEGNCCCMSTFEVIELTQNLLNIYFKL